MLLAIYEVRHDPQLVQLLRGLDQGHAAAHADSHTCAAAAARAVHVPTQDFMHNRQQQMRHHSYPNPAMQQPCTTAAAEYVDTLQQQHATTAQRLQELASTAASLQPSLRFERRPPCRDTLMAALVA